MSDRIVLDLSGTEDATQGGGGDFAALPTGWYQAVVYSVEVKTTKPTSKNPNKPYYNIRLNITQEGDYYKRVVFDGFAALFVTESAPFLAAKVEQLSRIAGVWDGEDRENVNIATPAELQGLEVEAYVKKERDSYREEQYEKENGAAPEEPIFTNRVNGYRPVDGWPSAEDLSKGTSKKKNKKNIAL